MFSLGSSRSHSSSTSESQALSRSGSSSESLSRGVSQSTSGSQGRSFTDIAFQDVFAKLYGDAAGAAGRMAELVPGFTEQAQTLFSGGLGFLEDLGAGDAYMERRLAGDDGLLTDQIDALGEDVGRFFREELMPGVTARGVGGGTYGGGRGRVAGERAATLAGEQFRRGVVDLRTADQAQRDELARSVMANRTAAAGTGLNALPGLLSIARGGFGAELAPWEALASIVGGPTTLGGSEQSSFSQATAEDVARAIAESFGFSEEYSKSSSNSKSKSMNIGIGG